MTTISYPALTAQHIKSGRIGQILGEMEDNRGGTMFLFVQDFYREGTVSGWRYLSELRVPALNGEPIAENTVADTINEICDEQGYRPEDIHQCMEFLVGHELGMLDLVFPPLMKSTIEMLTNNNFPKRDH